MDKKTKKEILKEQELMIKIMSYKVGQPTSEQLNEWVHIQAGYNYSKKKVKQVANNVADGLEYLGKQTVEGGKAMVDYAGEVIDSSIDYVKGEEGYVPDFIPLIGTKKKAQDAVKVAMATGAVLLSPVLPILVKYLCNTDLLPGLAKLYNGLSAGTPKAKNNYNKLRPEQKKKLYRFNLRYYSPGKMKSYNSWGIPTELDPGKSFPVSGHIGVRPDDKRLGSQNESKYWTDWGPGSSGAQKMGNAKSHTFTGSFEGCTPDSTSCGKTAEGNYYIYLTEEQKDNYYKQQPRFRNKKHSKWPQIKIEAADINVPSMPNFCDPKGYHIAKRNCADATSAVLGLPSGGGELPDAVAAKALAKFPNKNADGESTGAKTSGSSKPKEEKPKPKPTIRKAWEMNNKGAQQKYKTFEDFEYAARYYQKNGRPPQAIEDKPPYSYEK